MIRITRLLVNPKSYQIDGVTGEPGAPYIQRDMSSADGLARAVIDQAENDLKPGETGEYQLVLVRTYGVD